VPGELRVEMHTPVAFRHESLAVVHVIYAGRPDIDTMEGFMQWGVDFFERSKNEFCKVGVSVMEVCGCKQLKQDHTELEPSATATRVAPVSVAISQTPFANPSLKRHHQQQNVERLGSMTMYGKHLLIRKNDDVKLTHHTLRSSGRLDYS